MATIITENSVAGDLLILKEFYPYIKKEYGVSLKALEKLTKDGMLQIDQLVETAMPLCNKKLIRIKGAQNGADYTDGSDAKKTSFTKWSGLVDQWNGETVYTVTQHKYSIKICCKNKTGLLRVVAADPYENTVYFFKIPFDAHQGKPWITIGRSKEGNF